MLNVKQEKFIQNIVKGMSQREAYKDAYKAKYKDEAIDSKASTLFNLDKVQERYNELLKKTEDKTIMSTVERKKWLTKVINGEIKEDIPIMTNIDENNEINIIKGPTKLDTKLKALDTLNKMDGIYTTKFEGNLNLSYEEALKKVSGADEY